MGRLSAAAVAVLVGLILLLAFLPDSPDVTIKPDQSAQSEERIWNLRFGHNMPQDSAMHEAAALYAKTVEEKSKGRVRITVFPNQKLGNDHQMLEMARRGDLDIVLTPTAKISAAMPSMQYVDLPFFFPQREDLYAMLDGEPGQLLLNGLKQIAATLTFPARTQNASSAPTVQPRSRFCRFATTPPSYNSTTSPSIRAMPPSAWNSQMRPKSASASAAKTARHS